MGRPVNSSNGEIVIVDSDPDAGAALTNVFTRAGYRVTTLADDKLPGCDGRMQVPACVVLTGSASLDILSEIAAESYPAPILVLSDDNNVPSAVAAIRNGASDFIDKRLSADGILARVRTAIESWRYLRRDDCGSESALPSLPGYDLLTSREREVLFQIAAAASIKETGRSLGISPRTVAVHRRHIMQKLSVRDSVNLIRIVLNKARSS
jgi:FixJ family two-component response regulator